jgi:putative ABC transport system permease protein
MWKWRRKREREFSAELESHLNMHIADNMRAGMSAEEARRTALVALGGVQQTRERYRDAFAFAWLDALLKDFQFGFRTMRRSAGFTMLAVVTLAVGIASTNTAFTIVNTVMLRDLPFDEADRLVDVGIVEPDEGDTSLSYADFLDWQRSVRTFEGLSAFQTGNMNVSDDDIAPDRFLGSFVSANAFALLRVRPALGRDFLADEDRSDASGVVILSDRVWKRRYGGDSGILGRTVRIDAQPVTVIGVMPPSWEFPLTTALWRPLGQSRGLAMRRDDRNLAVFGRLADGVGTADAAAELNAIAANLARAFPETNAGTRAQVDRFRPGIGGPLTIVFGALMTAVGLLLLVSCANVANLLLARSLQRSREVSIRAAMGATRWRVVRQLLIESVMLATAAGLVALPLSLAATQLFSRLAEQIDTPFWMDFSMDATVFIFLCVVCLGTAIVFGLAPALHLSRASAQDVLKKSAGRTGTAGVWTHRWSGALIVAEVVLTVVLITGAVGMMRHLSLEMSVRHQIDTPRLLTMSLRLPGQKYSTERERSEFYRRLEERLVATHNIPSITVAETAPFVRGDRRRISVDGDTPTDSARLPVAEVLTVGARYFETVGLRVLRGRPLANDDAAAGREGVVVDQVFADRFFRGRDPVGLPFTLVADPATARRVTIVGVAQPLKRANLEESIPVVYLPYLADPTPSIVLLVRMETEAQTSALATALREEVRALDPDLPLFDIRTLDELLNWMMWLNRIFGGMFTIFAGIAVVVATVGIYGVVSYTMTQRTQEIGIRVALGAPMSRLWWAMMRGKAAQIAIGLALGVLAAFVLLGLMGGLLVGRFGQDPVTLAASGGFLLIVSIISMLGPIWRATSGSPVDALRYE